MGIFNRKRVQPSPGYVGRLYGIPGDIEDVKSTGGVYYWNTDHYENIIGVDYGYGTKKRRSKIYDTIRTLTRRLKRTKGKS